MISRWKQQWRALRESRPGERFEDRYRAANRKRDGGSLGGHIVRVGLAVALFAIGVVLVVIPGPAVLFFALAGALMATESLWVARALDWTELKVRAMLRFAGRWWQKSSAFARVAVCLVALGLASAAGYSVFQLMTD